jgi:LacI family transcriptional regulator
VSVTLADVAERAGVSPATVSRVLNSNYPVAASTRERVLRAVDELDYVVNGHARALAASSSDVLGIVVNDVADPFFGLMAGAVQAEASKEDLLAVICNTAGSPDEELRYIRLLLRQRAKAVVLTGGSRSGEAAYVEEFDALVRQADAAGTQVITCGRPAVAGSPAIALTFDNRRGAEGLTRHVVALGHRRIAYVTGPRASSTSADRLQGHRDALRQAKIPFDKGLVVHGTFDREAGVDAAVRLLDRLDRPTAIVAANDLIALGLIAGARELGVKVPAEVSVVGFDDLPFSVDTFPSLTTVRIPLVEVGRRAGRIAIGHERVAPGSVVRIRSELVVRDSLAAPR